MDHQSAATLTAAQRFSLFRGAGGCRDCADHGLLHERARPLFQPETTFTQRILFVSEAPNKGDTSKGFLTIDPKTDPSGRQCAAMLRAVGLALSDVLFTNAVLCLPAEKDGKHPVLAQQRKLCLRWLAKLIEDMDARVVVTLGTFPLVAVGHIKAHGLRLQDAFGKLSPWNGRHLLPLYHPGRLGQMTRPAPQQIEDFKAILPMLEQVGS
jgi:uracil-DNA glycosylase family 4